MRREIRMLAMDVDGTMTDGKIYMGADGEVCKAFNIKDGYGIVNLRRHGILPVIITGRVSKIVANRAKELGIEEVHQGIDDKERILREIASKHGFTLEETAYIGDDCNDIEVMKLSGFTFAPADAAAEILDYVDVVVSSKGGEGAVRDAADYLIRHQQKKA